MRFILAAALSAGLAFSALAADATLSQGERDFAMSSLHATRKLFLDSVSGMSDAQWNYKPAPDRWSAAECSEHIAVAEDFIAKLIQQALKSPAAPDKRIPAGEARAKDERLLAIMVDRSRKAEAPEPIRPTHRFATAQEAVDHFRQSRDNNIDFVEKTQADLRGHFAPHPLLGSLDLYQWLLLISAHSERHTKQILEVKASSGFPASVR
jgi:hypothetical protein